MSSNYTGSPTGVQAPASKPALAVNPVVVLPSDGDPLVAASVAQGFKECADVGAFFTNGRYPARSDTTPGMVWQTHPGNNRFEIDHNGYPMGAISVFQENWNTFATAISSPQVVQATNQWSILILAGGVVNFGGIGLLGSVGLTAEVTNNGDVADLFSANIVEFANFQSVVLEWDAFLDSVGTTNATAAVGIGSLTTGLYFSKSDSAGANWQLVANDATGPIRVDTGTPPVAGTPQNFRIELHGSLSQYGVTSGMGFINGSLVGTINMFLPPYGSGLGPFLALNKTSGTIARNLTVGPMRAVWNRYLSGYLL